MMNDKKTAIVHYWLTNFRGGEQVLAEFCRMYAGDLYTHAWDPEKIHGAPFDGHPVHQTFIGHLPLGVKHCQKFLPLMPLALKLLDMRKYDVILSSESGPAKGIRKRPGAIHICYCHTPMRYLWDMHDEYYRTASLPGKLAMKLFLGYLRHYDLESAKGVDYFIANSNFIADRIRRIYGREATVIYPPVNTSYFRRGDGVEKPDGGYYLVAGQLVPYKHAELAVAACLKAGRKLVVSGTGPQEKQLRSMAEGSDLIRFAGHVSNEELRNLYAGAKALLFPGTEDFGIVPLEAQSSGTPVIAYGEGGALETVVDGKTGLFFREKTADSLADAIRRFEEKTWNAKACEENADRFSVETFRRNIAAFVEEKTGLKAFIPE